MIIHGFCAEKRSDPGKTAWRGGLSTVCFKIGVQIALRWAILHTMGTNLPIFGFERLSLPGQAFLPSGPKPELFSALHPLRMGDSFRLNSLLNPWRVFADATLEHICIQVAGAQGASYRRHGRQDPIGLAVIGTLFRPFPYQKERSGRRICGAERGRAIPVPPAAARAENHETFLNLRCLMKDS